MNSQKIKSILFNSIFRFRGQTLVLVPLTLIAVSTTVVFIYSDMFKNNKQIFRRSVTQAMLQETTLSTFNVMEAALKRRMWEAPPDDDCLKADTFSVSGRTPYGIDWKVDAEFDHDLSIITMVAEGIDQFNGTLRFVKQIKVMDASDYLMISMNDKDPINLSRHWTGPTTRATSMVAGSRRIYINSPLQIDGNYFQDKRSNNFASTPNNTSLAYPWAYGIVLQGERIQLTKGLRYMVAPVQILEPYIQSPAPPAPPPPSNLYSFYLTNTAVKSLFESGGFNDGTINNMYATPFASSNRKYLWAQLNTSPLVVFSGSQQTEAENLKNYINDPTSVSLSDVPAESVLKTQTYPIALAGGNNLPIITGDLVDNGNYFSDITRWQASAYYHGSNYWYGGINASCVMKVGQSVLNPLKCTGGSITCPSFQWCSYSEGDDLSDRGSSPSGYERIKGFPEGFKAWRTAAGLEGTLKTGDTEELKVPRVDWDNLDALKEDAESCGVNLEKNPPLTGLTQYTDCPVWDKKSLDSYKQTESMNCHTIKVLRESDITTHIQGFNESVVNSADPKRILRRVIYSEAPLEIPQEDALGVWSNLSTVLREKTPIWVVNTDYTVFRGFQADKSTPVDPRIPRILSFNKDVSANSVKKAGLRLVHLSPERVHLISEQYVPMTYANLQSMYPVVTLSSGSKEIQAKRYNITDHSRHEGDAYVFGLRDFEVENVGLISLSTNVGVPQDPTTGSPSHFLLANRATTPNFLLKGLYYTSIYSELPARYLCMTWNNFDEQKVISSAYGNYTMQGKDPGDVLPPLASKFYRQNPLGSGVNVGLVNVAQNNIVPGLTPIPASVPAMPPLGIPWIFSYQQLVSSNTLNSSRRPAIGFTGLSLNFSFELLPNPRTPETQDLAEIGVSKYEVINTYRMAMPGKRFSFNYNPYYAPVTDQDCMCQTGTNCPMFLSNLRLNTGSLPQVTSLNVVEVNNGMSVVNFRSPASSFVGLGAILGVEMPVLKTTTSID